MQLNNLTSIPDETINKFVDFLDTFNIAKYLDKIHLTDSKAWLSKGFYYVGERRIRVYISCDASLYPFWRLASREEEKMGYMQFLVPNPERHVFFLLAHEIRHVWRMQVSKKNWVASSVHGPPRMIYSSCVFFHSCDMEIDAEGWAEKRYKEFYGVDLIKRSEA